MATTGAQYPIGTLRDMTAIPEDALPRFLAELPQILKESRRAYQAMDVVKSVMGDIVEDIESAPVWIDDDLDQVTITMRVEGEDEPIATSTVRRAKP